MPRVFLLSPAHCGGRRASQVVSPNARFALAEELRSRRGARLGDIFEFVSGLYFRGKQAYAMRFAAPPEPDNAIVGCGVQIITPNAGLRSPDTYVTRRAIRAFATTEVDPELLGGVVLDLDGTVYDGSLKSQLLHLSKQMAEGRA